MEVFALQQVVLTIVSLFLKISNCASRSGSESKSWHVKVSAGDSFQKQHYNRCQIQLVHQVNAIIIALNKRDYDKEIQEETQKRIVKKLINSTFHLSENMHPIPCHCSSSCPVDEHSPVPFKTMYTRLNSIQPIKLLTKYLFNRALPDNILWNWQVLKWGIWLETLQRNPINGKLTQQKLKIHERLAIVESEKRNQDKYYEEWRAARIG